MHEIQRKRDEEFIGRARYGSLVYFPGKSLLRENTYVRGPYESSLKDVLLEMGIRSYYEPTDLEIYRIGSYKPDFVTDMRMNGKRVILEPHRTNGKHGGLSWNQKMLIVKDIYGCLFYFIHINSWRVKRPLVLRFGEDKHVDERWNIPKIGDPESWKKIIKDDINELRRRADPAR